MTKLERAIRSQPVELERVRSVVETTDVPAIQPPDRALVLVGAGAGYAQLN